MAKPLAGQKCMDCKAPIARGHGRKAMRCPRCRRNHRAVYMRELNRRRYREMREAVLHVRAMQQPCP
jgi:DNA-directed RNA polymerase subunit RPC12/RpoP